MYQLKNLSNVDMLGELPFYDELNMVKTPNAFKKMQEALALK